MSKELEEFKEEIKGKIDEILNIDRHNMVKIEQLRELSEELKPKPEFIEGEIVKAHFNGVPVLVEVNNVFYNDTAAYPARTENLKNCKKIESLPMHMTDHDGSDRCPPNVTGGTLIYALFSDGEYGGGKAKELNWIHIIRYQILKDLEAV